MTCPTWAELRDYHCSQLSVTHNTISSENPFYEELASRRYNYSPLSDGSAFRLVFLKGVLSEATNQTLRRNGRFIWCRNLSYAGRNTSGLRQIHFTVDKGSKLFTVAESDVLCIPSKAYINNNRYFRTSQKTFLAFSSVFGYEKILTSMSKNMKTSRTELAHQIAQDNPYQCGALVAPRLGYFYPEPPVSFHKHRWKEEHPCGLVLGRAFDRSDYMGRELYRVRFGDTTYEKVNPVQLEIINEV